MKQRLDQSLVLRGLVTTRSQAENLIRLGKVTVDGVVVTKAGTNVREDQDIVVTATERYVSRAGLKLSSVAALLHLNFADITMLDVGSSTGGFTDYALQNGAKKVFAVDVGTDQLHPILHGDARIELHEKTDIRDFAMDETPDLIVIDVSFISLREILPAIARLSGPETIIVAMAKPQFEAERREASKGVIKNETMRRAILKRLEETFRQKFVIIDKADSDVSGAKGNRERFYKLKLSK